jgi:hypothetical protein
MAYLTIQFSRSAEWQSTLIAKLCHGPFSHVDLVLNDGNLLGASDNKDAPVIDGNPQGVAIRPPEYQHFAIRRQMILDTDLADAIIAQWMTQLGKPFDSGGLHTFLDEAVFERNWRDPAKWFCSEGVVWAKEQAGYWKRELLWAKSRLSPMDLYMLNMMDDRFVNWATFWLPISDLKLSPGET